MATRREQRLHQRCSTLQTGYWKMAHNFLLLASQDFRTGYYTLTSPRSLVAAQLVGAFIGVLFAPGVYAFYTHSFDVGVDYEYSVPYAKVLPTSCAAYLRCWHDHFAI